MLLARRRFAGLLAGSATASLARPVMAMIDTSHWYRLTNDFMGPGLLLDAFEPEPVPQTPRVNEQTRQRDGGSNSNSNSNR